MRAGRLDTRMILQRKVESRDSVGGVSWAWEDVAEMWAEVRGLQGREFFAAQQVNATATHQVTIRYRAGVTANMRFVEKSAPTVGYDIIAAPSNPRRTEIVAVCVVREADGWRAD